MKKISLILVSFLLFNNLTAQNPNMNQKIGTLTGTVLDSLSGLPLDYVSVKLYSVKDSSVKAGVYTNEKGSIYLEEIPLGKYYIKILFSGYKTKTLENVNFTLEKPIKDIGKIGLNFDKGIDLEEVKVIGKKELLINNIDKKVYNVDEDLSVRGGTVNDILNNLPSVEIDQEGKISLRGDGNVTILIDGRPSSISGGNGRSFLESLPANSIERIEIVTNPSSKYDPDGTSGIINIVLKKNKLKGINGNVTLSGGTGNDHNATAGISIRNAKVNLYGNYSYKYYEGYRNSESEIERNLSDNYFKLAQNRTGTDLMINNTARFGSDFYINDRNTLGFSSTFNLGSRERKGDLFNYQYSIDQEIEKYWIRSSSDPSESQSMDFNLNYKIDFKEDRGNIMFDVNHSIGKEAMLGLYSEDYITSFMQNDIRQDLFQDLKNDEKFNVTTAQIDVIRILPKNIRLETGVKAILRDSYVDTYSQTQDTITKLYFEDTLSNFEYEYLEEIFSVYANVGQQIKKFKYQGGLRAERALQAPNLISDTLSFKNEYYNIFPTAFIKYELNKANELSFSYSRRINRPNSENLNPFTSYADPFNLRRGNPELTPEFINSFDFGYTFNKEKISLTASFFYRQTKDVISRIKYFYDNGASAVSYGNIQSSQSIGPELIVNYKPKSWFKNVFSLNGSSVKFTDNVSEIDFNNSGFFWSAKYTGTIEFWKKTASIQVNARYNSPIVRPQGIVQPRASVDISGEKSLKNNKWAIGFRFTDVFDTKEFRLNFEQESIALNQYMRFKQNTRRFYINLSYKFGKYEIKKARNSGEGGGFDF
jgi:outer membrane receptor protein involved in Fe transport